MAVYGTPDSVAKQLKSLYKKVGGFGHLIGMLHSVYAFKHTAKSMKLFAEEAVPQLKDLGTVSSSLGPLKDRGTPVKAAKFNGRTAALLQPGIIGLKTDKKGKGCVTMKRSTWSARYSPSVYQCRWY